MSINTPDGHSFSVYPKQYEMKEKLTEEEASTELLYRNEDVYAFGHGCAAIGSKTLRISSNYRQVLCQSMKHLV
ncbi:hypothetical protein ACT7DL_24275 [Bacillus paranthracis]